MQKILITTGIFPPDIGGPASYVPLIAKSLTERGHEVQVLTLSNTVLHNDSGYPFCVTRIVRGQFKPFRWIKTINRIIRLSYKADVVYVNGLAFESMIGATLANKPTVHKVVGDYAWERAVSYGWYGGSFKSYQKASKTSLLKILDIVRTMPLKKTNKIITPGNYLKKSIIGWGVDAEKIRVVYNAVNIEEYSESTSNLLPLFTGKSIAIVCRLIPLKCVDALIRVISQLENVRLIIIGDGPLRSSLEKFAFELKINKRILFMGNIPKAMVIPILLKSDIFVLNSTHEGLPHVILEAMAAGTPVIATDVGGTGEVVLDGVTGRLIPSGDEVALFSAIKEILEKPDLARGMADEAAKMLKERFVFKNMVDDTEATLKLVAKK